mmetsp:Transcript_841/g.1982  ORF Transcript_841/g.1982 Transcript_841/m.1982 type:complete len:521 (-) Transcript_841:94-1656(-)
MPPRKVGSGHESPTSPVDSAGENSGTGTKHLAEDMAAIAKDRGGEKVTALLAQTAANKKSVMYRIWLTLEEPESSVLARIYMLVMTFVIAMSVVVTVFESATDGEIRQYLGEDFFNNCEIFFGVVFTVEIVARFAVSRRRSIFFWTHRTVTQDNFYNIVDALSIVPFYLSLAIGKETVKNNQFFALVTTMRPTLRLLKVTRNFAGFQLLVRSLKIALPQLTVPLFLFFLLTLFFGSLIWLVEHENEEFPDDFASIPQSMWFAIVTVSTVGYGDVSPHTFAGKLLASGMIVLGILYMAMPLTVVGSAFSRVWESKEQIFVIENARRRMRQMGIDVTLLKSAFDAVDTDESGTMDYDEFEYFLSHVLGLGMNQKKCRALFHFFDADESGEVSFFEFAEQVVDLRELHEFQDQLKDDDESQPERVQEDPEKPSVDSLVRGLTAKIAGLDALCRQELSAVRAEVRHMAEAHRQNDKEAQLTHRSMNDPALTERSDRAAQEALSARTVPTERPRELQNAMARVAL